MMESPEERRERPEMPSSEPPRVPEMPAPEPEHVPEQPAPREKGPEFPPPPPLPDDPLLRPAVD